MSQKTCLFMQNSARDRKRFYLRASIKKGLSGNSLSQKGSLMVNIRLPFDFLAKKKDG
ncbi:hypothetical protein [Acetobacterium malicum]|uniref:hypothetical protein n=1 Tax=Acetobacterium malicum TaxID=52692 RepID=UPI0012EB0874|nr:hypothetical protein [Acetobacterium dehalogenans]